MNQLTVNLLGGIIIGFLSFYLGVYIEYSSPSFESFAISWEAVSAIATIAIPLVLFYFSQKQQDEQRKREENREKLEQQAKELQMINDFISAHMIPNSINIKRSNDSYQEDIKHFKNLSNHWERLSLLPTKYYKNKLETICSNIIHQIEYVNIFLSDEEVYPTPYIYTTLGEIQMYTNTINSWLTDDGIFNFINTISEQDRQNHKFNEAFETSQKEKLDKLQELEQQIKELG